VLVPAPQGDGHEHPVVELVSVQQIGSDRRRGFGLLEKVFGVDVGEAVLCCMVVGVQFSLFAGVFLDLDGSGDSLLTEGSFIASGAAGDNLR
jgi:hypothetical protein